MLFKFLTKVKRERESVMVSPLPRAALASDCCCWSTLVGCVAKKATSAGSTPPLVFDLSSSVTSLAVKFAIVWSTRGTLSHAEKVCSLVGVFEESLRSAFHPIWGSLHLIHQPLIVVGLCEP